MPLLLWLTCLETVNISRTEAPETASMAGLIAQNNVYNNFSPLL